MATTITVQTTQLKDVTMHFDPAKGGFQVVVVAELIDDTGKLINSATWVREFADMTAGLQSDINGLMRELSQEVNATYANDPTSTWVDL